MDVKDIFYLVLKIVEERWDNYEKGGENHNTRKFL